MTQQEDFDPYYKWLAIPPDQQPPNLYRLLGLQLYESNVDVIDSAADARLNHLRSFQAGPRGAISQQIANEVCAARICLLNEAKRQEYDRRLGEQIAAEKAANAPPAMRDATPIIDTHVAPPPIAEIPIQTGVRPNKQTALIAAGVCTLVLFSVGAAISWFAMSGPDEQVASAQGKSDSDLTTSVSNSIPTEPSEAKNDSNSKTSKSGDSGTGGDTGSSPDAPAENDADSTPVYDELGRLVTADPGTQGVEAIKPDAPDRSAPDPTKMIENSVASSNTKMTDSPGASDSSLPDTPAGVNDPDETMQPQNGGGDVFDMLDSIQPPISPPEVELLNSAELYQEYADDFEAMHAGHRASISKLKQQAVDAVQRFLAQAESNAQQDDAALAKRMLAALDVDDPAALTVSGSAPAMLDTVASTFNSELVSRENSLQANEETIAKTFLDGINGVSRELKRKRKNEQSNYLRNYARLMETRIEHKPVTGKLAYLAKVGINNAVWHNGEKLKFDTGISQTVKLQPDDIIAIEFYSNYRYRAVNLTFVSTDRKIYIPIRREHVKNMSGNVNPADITLDMIDDAIGSPEEGVVDPQLLTLQTDSGLPMDNQGGSQWFSGPHDVPELYAIRITADMIRSIDMDLAGLPEPDLEQMGEIRKIELDKRKGMLLVFGSDSTSAKEQPIAEKLCTGYGLPYVVVKGFDKDHRDFSKIHTIVCGSNEMRYWSSSQVRNEINAFQYIEKFVNDGGHLFVFGSFNSSGMQPLEVFGVFSGFQQAKEFTPSGNASTLFFSGNRRLLPRDNALQAVGDFRCEVPHAPILRRGPNESDAGGPMIATFEHGKGRVTVTSIEPAWQNSEWIMPPAFSWIARGSPYPADEIVEGVTE